MSAPTLLEGGSELALSASASRRFLNTRFRSRDGIRCGRSGLVQQTQQPRCHNGRVVVPLETRTSGRARAAPLGLILDQGHEQVRRATHIVDGPILPSAGSSMSSASALTELVTMGRPAAMASMIASDDDSEYDACTYARYPGSQSSTSGRKPCRRT